MQDIKKREEKIQEKRKQTPFRDFVKEIGSWFSFVLYKQDGLICKYPNTQRIQGVEYYKTFNDNCDLRIKNGLEIDFSKSFFEQWTYLFQNTKLPNILNYGNVENCDFANEVLRSKNIYLSYTVIGDCENVLYSNNVKEGCNNVLNSTMVWQNSENIYFTTGIISSSNIFYSKYINNSYNIRFSHNLISCQNCIECHHLENQSYCINNQQYTKEEYEKESKKILTQKEDFLVKYKNITQKGENFGSTNVEGIFIQNSENVKDGLFGFQLKDCKNAVMWGGKGVNENMYDVISGGTVTNNDFYGVTGAGAGSNNIYCSCHIVSSNIYYSYFMQGCSYCLGCIGLTNKQFCIFNKEYSKEERFELANKIFEQMDADGTLGNFFQPQMNPHYFNDTLAYLIDDSFTKEEVEAEGYLRRDEEIKVDIPDNADIIGTNELNNFQGFNTEGERTINPEILKKVIKDEKGNYYRIVQMEYDFLMKHGLPLPELHWLERIKLGFKFDSDIT